MKIQHSSPDGSRYEFDNVAGTVTPTLCGPSASWIVQFCGAGQGQPIDTRDFRDAEGALLRLCGGKWPRTAAEIPAEAA